MKGVTAVHMAAQNGHTDVVSLLLSRSAGLLRIADKHGRTPLHLSAAHGHSDMSLLLIGQGADIDAYDKVGNLACSCTMCRPARQRCCGGLLHAFNVLTA